MTGPMYVDWAITSECNLNCRHCVGMEQGELTGEEAIKIANDIIGLSPKWVILEGGEPLLREDLHQIGGMFKREGIDVFVITNGNAFNQDRLQKLASFSPKVLFSIDGADEAVYEDTKRGARFEVAKEWAAQCAALGIFCGITTVLSKLNLGQVRELIQLTESLGGARIIFLPLKPFGKDEVSTGYYRQYALTPKEQEELTFGNAAQEPLEDIWLRMRQSEVLTNWADKSVRKGACGKCQQFESCRGCLARTMRLSGDALETDLCCPFVA